MENQVQQQHRDASVENFKTLPVVVSGDFIPLVGEYTSLQTSSEMIGSDTGSDNSQ